MDDSALVIETLPEIGAIAPGEWDVLVPDNHPFLRHAFLKSLEDAGCVGGETGWQPCHVRLASAGRTLAAAPLYLKSHSQGEYVFDHGWANAYHQAGGDYYPKLQLCVPFSPVPGPRLLCGEDAGHRAVLIEGLKRITERMGVSGLHVTFCQKEDWQALADAGFLTRIDHQFHWTNEDYRHFDDFLAALSASRRKTIRRERRDAVAGGLEIDILSGSAITEAHWDAMYAFYMDTGSRKWGRPYLTREFFSLIGERMADDILLVMARRNGRYIAGAINFIGSDTLFGRNWGCIEDHPFLHFEVCYHQAIDFAIERKLKVVEAGAQGEHKLARGYRPVTTHSAHYIAHPSLRSAIADYLKRERREVARMSDYLEEHTPFRKGDSPADGSELSEPASSKTD
jgi:predicted N-acyltransferase